MEDTRCRYFHSIMVDKQVLWEGFLLHDEAWSILKKLSNKHPLVSIICNEKQISQKSDTFNY